MQAWAPRQRTSDQRWDFSVGSDENEGTVRPAGYCAGWKKYTDAERKEIVRRHGKEFMEALEKDRLKKLEFEHKYHTNGHETSAQAVECYREFNLDNYLRFSENIEEMRKCGVCDEWTTKRAYLAGDGSYAGIIAICSLHASRENVAKVFWPKNEVSPDRKTQVVGPPCTECGGTGVKPHNLACAVCYGSGKVND